ncbi:MAG: hypothetical protein NTV39_00070 [Candidatus Saccharibacteria bacterium]|nr:hypothetical protein [Candidatus Saccharibacteria bacterium]
MNIKSFKTIIAGFVAVSFIVLSMGTAQIVSASDLSDGAAAAQPKGSNPCLFTTQSCPNGLFTNIVNIMLFVIGAVAVLMLIYGGIRYTTSGGDAKNVTAAKDTILYGVVGIVVAILAYAIVNFVITKLT